MEIIAGDLTDPDSVGRMVRGVDTVFHLGALIAIPYSYQAPLSYIRTNIEGSHNVFRAALDHGVRRVVHTSTSEVYGTARTVPIREDHPLQGQSPYSASKIAADKLAEAFHASFHLPVVILRPFNTFGPRQSARAVIPSIITQCLQNGVVKMGSQTPTRDLNYVGNSVDAFLLAATTEGILGETIHFGTGREIQIGDLARLITGHLGVPLQIETEEERIRPENSEVQRLVADPGRAAKLLGWQPRVSFEEGLAQTIEWFKVHHAAYDTSRYVV